MASVVLGACACIMTVLAGLSMLAGYFVSKKARNVCPEYELNYYAYNIDNSYDILLGSEAITSQVGPFSFKYDVIEDEYEDIEVVLVFDSDKTPDGLSLDGTKFIVPDIPLWNAVNQSQMEISRVTSHGYRKPFISLSLVQLLEGYSDNLPCLAMGLNPQCPEDTEVTGPSKSQDYEINWATFNSFYPGCSCMVKVLQSSSVPTEYVDRPEWRPDKFRGECYGKPKNVLEKFCSPLASTGDGLFQSSACWMAPSVLIAQDNVYEESYPCRARVYAECSCTREEFKIHVTIGSGVAQNWPDVARMKNNVSIPLLRVTIQYGCTPDSSLRVIGQVLIYWPVTYFLSIPVLACLGFAVYFLLDKFCLS